MNTIIRWNHYLALSCYISGYLTFRPFCSRRPSRRDSVIIANPIAGHLVTGLEFGCALQAGIKGLKESIECSTLFSPTRACYAFFIEGFFATDKTILGYSRFLNGKEGQPTSFYMNDKGQHVWTNKFKP
jgi:hypothetical protein